MTLRSRTRQLTLIAMLLLTFSRPSLAQDEVSELGWEFGGGAAMASAGFAYNWLTPYGDEPVVCRYLVRGAPNQQITVAVTIHTPYGDFNKIGAGWGVASASAVMPSIYQNSPGEYFCQGSYTASPGGAGQAQIEARSSAFWARYVRLVWDYDVIEYAQSNCSVPGQQDQLTMSNPAPGWSNVNDPPPYTADEGYRFTAQGQGWPLYINVYKPRGFLPPCLPPQ